MCILTGFKKQRWILLFKSKGITRGRKDTRVKLRGHSYSHFGPFGLGYEKRINFIKNNHMLT